MRSGLRVILSLVFMVIEVQWSLIVPAVAQTSSEAPYAGTYYCYTTGLATDPYANNRIAPRPAPFGKLILDGKGGYTLSAKGQKGRYVYEPRAGKLSFTGFLAATQVSDYAAGSFKLNYHSANGTYAFNCTTDGANDARAQKKAKPETVQRLVAGRFAGDRACASTATTAIEIQLTPDSDNNLDGVVVLHFAGAASRRPTAKYAVKGRWFKEAYISLRPDHWLENPENLPLPDGWINAEVYEDGLSHVKMSDSCPNFSLKRVAP
jgi:hypothetical protein